MFIVYSSVVADKITPQEESSERVEKILRTWYAMMGGARSALATLGVHGADEAPRPSLRVP